MQIKWDITVEFFPSTLEPKPDKQFSQLHVVSSDLCVTIKMIDTLCEGVLQYIFLNLIQC